MDARTPAVWVEREHTWANSAFSHLISYRISSIVAVEVNDPLLDVWNASESRSTWTSACFIAVFQNFLSPSVIGCCGTASLQKQCPR
jgi:hypothetical protein